MITMSSNNVGLPSSDSTRVRPPRAPGLVRNPAPEEVGARIDWSCWYLSEEDDMGHGSLHMIIIVELLPALQAVVRQRGWTDAFVGGDQFIAWVEHEPNVRVSPDIYLVRPAPKPAPDSWQLWRPGHLPPRFAVEIVSPGSWRKDYQDNPAKYAQIGVDELLIFDRIALMDPNVAAERYVLQLYQREADGAFVKTYTGDGPIYSHQLDLWLFARVEGSEPRLRLSHDPEGQQLVPSQEEKDQQLQQAAQREKQERRARLKAERELQQLREELARGRDRSPEPSDDA